MSHYYSKSSNTCPKLSIIIPAYNVEDYLHYCLESILRQSFSEFEVILINDGSTDSTQSICEKFEKKDSRIKLYNKKNSGVSSSRNLGLQKAIGTYIWFVDSDDWIENEFLANIFSDIGNNDYDFIHYSGYHGDENEILPLYPIINQKKIFSNILDYFNSQKPFRCTLVTRIFRNKLIKNNGLSFLEDVKYCEDLLFCAKCMTLSKKIYTTNISGYYYRKRDLSAMNSYHDNSHIMHHLLALKDLKEFMLEKNLSLKQEKFLGYCEFEIIKAILAMLTKNPTVQFDFNQVKSVFIDLYRDDNLNRFNHKKGFFIFLIKKFLIQIVIFNKLRLKIKKII